MLIAVRTDRCGLQRKYLFWAPANRDLSSIRRNLVWMFTTKISMPAMAARLQIIFGIFYYLKRSKYFLIGHHYYLA